MIPTLPFGRTGHASSRVVFGAAALAVMPQDRADAVLETLREFGINHLDTAAKYGESELRLAPWLQRDRDAFFLASKTGDRDAEGARRSIDRSLERLGVDQLDLIQLHNLTQDEDWKQALGPGGALEACLEARDAGRVRFIGVTGHGTYAPAFHLRSLERHAFDSVLVPYSHILMQSPDYAADFERLVSVCEERGVAIQTIKSVARRRWPEDATPKRFAWYEPLSDPEAIRRAVHFVLARPGFFLNTSSDATLLRTVLEAAAGFPDAGAAPDPGLLAEDARAHGMEPIFVRDVSDQI